MFLCWLRSILPERPSAHSGEGFNWHIRLRNVGRALHQHSHCGNYFGSQHNSAFRANTRSENTVYSKWKSCLLTGFRWILLEIRMPSYLRGYDRMDKLLICSFKAWGKRKGYSKFGKWKRLFPHLMFVFQFAPNLHFLPSCFAYYSSCFPRPAFIS